MIVRAIAPAVTFALLAACSSGQPKPDSQGSNAVIYELAGTRWALVRLGDKDVKISEGGREAYIYLSSADASVVGYAGCNRISSTHESSGARLTFGEVIATRMYCEDMPTETALLDAMKATVGWRISGSQLQLLNAQQGSLATFEARNL